MSCLEKSLSLGINIFNLLEREWEAYKNIIVSFSSLVRSVKLLFCSLLTENKRKPFLQIYRTLLGQIEILLLAFNTRSYPLKNYIKT